MKSVGKRSGVVIYVFFIIPGQKEYIFIIKPRINLEKNIMRQHGHRKQ